MGKAIRVRQGDAYWRKAIARQESSGLSVLAFCRRERINAGTLYGWRSRLRTEPRKAPRELGAAEPSDGFIDLGAFRESDASWEIRLELGGGVVLQLRRG